MTPPSIAAFMACKLVADLDAPSARLLEPAAGAGMLAAAVRELLAKARPPERVGLLIYELDPCLLAPLEDLGRQLAARRAASRLTGRSAGRTSRCRHWRRQAVPPRACW